MMTATIPDRLESKYKDASPIETVHRIHNILTGLGLSTVGTGSIPWRESTPCGWR